MVYANAPHAVAAHAHTTPRHRLDGIRITAGAGAIATNAALLLLMLTPMAVPELRPNLSMAQDIVWIPRERPTPPLPPVEVPVKPVKAAVRNAAITRPRPVDPPSAQTPAMAGDTSATAMETIPGNTLGSAEESAVTAPGEVLAGAVLQYASAPAPAYPREALKDGLTGTVVLEVLVGTDGRPLRAEVVDSSGHRTLDLAARRQVLARWMFRPALRAGVPVQAIGRVPVEFRLDR